MTVDSGDDFTMCDHDEHQCDTRQDVSDDIRGGYVYRDGKISRRLRSTAAYLYGRGSGVDSDVLLPTAVLVRYEYHGGKVFRSVMVLDSA